MRWSAFLVALLAFATGCSGSRTLPAAADMARVRDATTSGGSLLYVSDWYHGKILMLAYPGGALTGTIDDNQFPLGLCSDAAGNVWVTNFTAASDQVVEYAHGGTTPIGTLDDSGEAPRGCSVNPVTGDLAVANGYPGDVVIYPRATGAPITYKSKVLYPFACTYDAAGNLYVDGYRSDRGDQTALVVLPSGGVEFQGLPIHGTVGLPGDLQWDGSELALGDYGSPSTLYQLKPSKQLKYAAVKSTILLHGPQRQPTEGVQFWVQNGTLVMPFGRKHTVNLIGSWNYPAGGTPTSVWDGYGPDDFYGVTLSVMPSPAPSPLVR